MNIELNYISVSSVTILCYMLYCIVGNRYISSELCKQRTFRTNFIKYFFWISKLLKFTVKVYIDTVSNTTKHLC